MESCEVATQRQSSHSHHAFPHHQSFRHLPLLLPSQWRTTLRYNSSLNSNRCTCSLAMMWQNTSKGLPYPPVRARVFNKDSTYLQNLTSHKITWGNIPFISHRQSYSRIFRYTEKMQTSIRSSRMGRIMGGEHCGFQTRKDGQIYYNVYNCTFSCEGPKAEWWVASFGANRTGISALEPW